jgi:hypothetical protein
MDPVKSPYGDHEQAFPLPGTVVPATRELV